MKILLVCSGGMSTSLLVESMKKAASLEKIACEITSIPVTHLAAAAESADCILVAPQIRHQLSAVKKTAESKRKPVALIDGSAYGRIAGKEVLHQALQLVS